MRTIDIHAHTTPAAFVSAFEKGEGWHGSHGHLGGEVEGVECQLQLRVEEDNSFSSLS